GCSVQRQVAENKLHRIQPRYNPNANDWWMCDAGRYENQYVSAPERLDGVKIRRNNAWEPLEWPQAIREVYNHVADVALQYGGSHLAVVLSPHLTCEEAYLLASYATSILADVALVVGKIPSQGQDEKFKAGFTIRAEKCPNRRGVEEIVRHFAKQPLDWVGMLAKIESGEIQGAYVTGGYPDAWIDDAEAAKFERLESLVVQDILPSPLARRAKLVLPGVTAFEKDGSYVNHAGLIQSTSWGLRPHGGAHVDGQTFADLLGRRGIYHAADVLLELAAKVPFFARCAQGVPPAGLNLVTGQEKRPLTTELGTVTHPTPTFRSEASRMLEVEAPVLNPTT
ncbi:MAG: molybdopterin-dependent oxidoreductase, partial [Planctomycetales bacterium]